MVTHLKSSEFNQFIKDGVVLVDFYATWCGPCKLMAPVIEELSNEVANVKFAKVDVEESSDISEKFNISSIPTFLVFHNGQMVKEMVGAVSKDALKTAITT